LQGITKRASASNWAEKQIHFFRILLHLFYSQILNVKNGENIRVCWHISMAHRMPTATHTHGFGHSSHSGSCKASSKNFDSVINCEKAETEAVAENSGAAEGTEAEETGSGNAMTA
jgi:hypothetical protein